MENTRTRRRILAASGFLAASALAGCLDGGPEPEPPNGDDDENGNGGDGENGDDDTNGNDVPEPVEGKSDLPPARDVNPVTDVEDTAALVELVRGNTAFASDVYRQVLGDAEEDNFVISPYSISAALAMTRAGARGDTADALDDAMRYVLEDDALHTSFAALRAEMDARNDVELDEDEDEEFILRVVNAAWGQEGYPFLEDYLETLEAHYGAGLREVDFGSDPEGAREEINDWVAEQTEDRIDDLLPEGSIDPLTTLVLTNAIYLNASWATPFPDDATDKAEFTLLDGNTKDVQMMRNSARYPYAELDGHQAVELPYVGGDVSMVVVLPSEDVEFVEFERSLDAPRLVEFTDALENEEGTVRMPRFGFESSFALKDVLSSLGAEVAFDPTNADFGGMVDLDATGENLFIDDVYHDTFIEVDEEGTEAAAATGVVVGRTSAPTDPFEMTVDRPFVFFLRDRRTGTVLFLGRVVEPEDPHD